MNKVLEKIITRKQKDLVLQKEKLGVEDLKEQITQRRSPGLFASKITSSHVNPAIIAEVKFASPSAGDMAMPASLISRIRVYEGAGADAISVITEPHFFKGDIEFIQKVKEITGLPVLQKDFVIDEYQIYEAALAGADALLLITRLVDAEELSRFVDLCLDLKIEPVVEIYSSVDLEKAVKTNSKFIAVNARDLDTFDVNIEKACGLLKKIPGKFIRLAFSGIESANEVSKYKEAGARGVLIGTSLMKAKKPEAFLMSLRETSQDGTLYKTLVKICGIRSIDSALAALEAGADFLGFNFVKTSRRFIQPQKALEIINKVRKINPKVQIVGVFQDEHYSKVNEIAKFLKLDYVQLHGKEDKVYIKKMITKVIKKVEDNFEVGKKKS